MSVGSNFFNEFCLSTKPLLTYNNVQSNIDDATDIAGTLLTDITSIFTSSIFLIFYHKLPKYLI